MQLKTLVIIFIFCLLYLVSGVDTYADTTKYITDSKNSNNLTIHSDGSVMQSINNDHTSAYTGSNADNQTINDTSDQKYSKRVLENQNDNKVNQIIKRDPTSNYENDNTSSIKPLEIPSTPDNYFNGSDKPKTFNHTFRFPLIGVHFFSKQVINDGRNVGIHSGSKVDSSLGASYLYNLSKNFRIGPEILHTDYNNTSDILVEDSFSFLLRAEYVFYQNKSMSFYALGGFGLSINQMDLVFTKLAISNNSGGNNNDSYQQFTIQPIINGSSVPQNQPYFYCGAERGLTYNSLTTNVIPDPKDPNKGTTVFSGKGSGTCIIPNNDNSSTYTVNYQNYLVPVSATSLPWFVGFGVDYDLTPLIKKIFVFSTTDSKLNTQNNAEIGLSFTARYFDNGTSRVQHREDNQMYQYTVRYTGYLDTSFGLYYRM
ncbi:hypothetical protein ACFX5K_01075 [Rickettsiales bacterium LUAb2]